MRRSAATAGAAQRSAKAPHRPGGRREGWNLGTLAGWRAAAYRLFAASLLPPDPGRLRWLADLAGELDRYQESLASLGFFGPWRHFLGELERLSERDVVALQAEHVRLFSVSPSGTACFPFESRYLSRGGQETGWIAVQLEQTYRRAGLKLGPSNESPDHAAVELEFMAYLCGQEAAAWERSAAAEALELLGGQRLFLRLHLGRWFGELARQIRAATDEPFFARAAEAADAFVQHDRDLVDALVGELERSAIRAGAADHSSTIPSGEGEQ